jgi:oligosaccharyltransferase complex subunit delta (ribophorin II)
MRFTQSIAPALLLLAAGVTQAASGWGFDDGSIQIAAKKGESVKEKYAAIVPRILDVDGC